MILKKTWRKIFLIFIILMALSLIYSSKIWSQYWTALPPYNTLWPLWSPALSPIDPVTGLATPVVNSLTVTTVLPVQPGLAWDPKNLYPWLLYNSPFDTLLFYDPVFGIKSWPPPGFIKTIPGIGGNILGIPNPINLPPDFSTLPPTDSTLLFSLVPLANIFYGVAYQYYSKLTPTISPLFPFLPAGANLPTLNPSTLASIAIKFTPTGIVPTVLSASALLGL
jgi:hypothetical protein